MSPLIIVSGSMGPVARCSFHIIRTLYFIRACRTYRLVAGNRAARAEGEKSGKQQNSTSTPRLVPHRMEWQGKATQIWRPGPSTPTDYIRSSLRGGRTCKRAWRWLRRALFAMRHGGERVTTRVGQASIPWQKSWISPRPQIWLMFLCCSRQSLKAMWMSSSLRIAT